MRKITFNPDNTYKKAVNVLPYHLNPILNLNSKGNINNEKKLQKEITNFLKIPFINIEPNFNKVPEIKINSSHFNQKFSSSLCKKVKYKNKENQELETDLDQEPDFFQKAHKIFPSSVVLTLKNNLKFSNNEKITKDTIKNNLKFYLNKEKSKMTSEHKSYFWILKLKNALNYYRNPRFLANNSLKFFQEEENDDFQFGLIFEEEYISDNSLMDIIKWLNEIVLIPDAVLDQKNDFDTYGTPQNPLISYGNYVINQYIPEEGLLLSKRTDLDDKARMENILYKVYLDEKSKIKDFENGLLNELELTEEKDKHKYKQFATVPKNQQTILFLNQGPRHDDRLMMDENIKKTVPSIVSDNNFQKVLNQLIRQKVEPNFIASVEKKTNLFDYQLSDEILNIKDTLEKSYLLWKSKNPSSDLIVLDLVIEKNDIRKKELADFIKKELENSLNTETLQKIKINVLMSEFNERAGVFLEEFQKTYDLLIADVFLEESDDFLITYYLSLLDKMNVSDNVLFEYAQLPTEQQTVLSKILKISSNHLGITEIEQCYENYHKNKNKISVSEMQIVSIFFETLKKFIKEEIINKNNSVYVLFENYKYIAYQNLQSQYFEYYEKLDDIKIRYFSLKK
ncbi:hypothetical protein [Candidatus Phytoplasma pruni]|uniref:Uncharacterized protein n=1 Tax=Candidatus Phytoplasma pruni TaxID=479893 RepID=A0A851HDH2_9MOLU|nr:hypothetical protein [Candidatus Phytoplasma pruni]NWN46141.1 hypothetical protein [Candidatus Phytoplasma pruni]